MPGSSDGIYSEMDTGTGESKKLKRKRKFRDKVENMILSELQPVTFGTSTGNSSNSHSIDFNEIEEFNSRYINEYETTRCLGKGGFGIVFEARHKLDECSYAIKRIPLSTEEMERDRVLREVKALAKLEHQNIVRYFGSWIESPPVGWQCKYDMKWLGSQSMSQSKMKKIKSKCMNMELSLSNFEAEKSNSSNGDSFISESKNSDEDKHPECLYIQMQLCQDESLKEWLRTHLDRDHFVVVDMFSQLLEAVEYIHLKGLIHRDLKPSNIFFSLNGQVQVGDFGLVKDMEDALNIELVRNGSSFGGHTIGVGTQLYMSPEQCQSCNYDHRVDIYSLGLIFFELLIPFSTEMERLKTLTAVKEVIFPTEFKEKFPDEHRLLQNMLCKDPNERLTVTEIKGGPPFKSEDLGYSED